MSSVVATSNAELRHAVILSLPHLFLLIVYTLKMFNRRTVGYRCHLRRALML